MSFAEIFIPFGREAKVTCCSGLVDSPPPGRTSSATATSAAAAAPANASPTRVRRRRSEIRSLPIAAATLAASNGGGTGVVSKRAGSASERGPASAASCSSSARQSGQPSRWASSPTRSSSGSWPSACAPRDSRHSRQPSVFIAHLLQGDAEGLEGVVDAALHRAHRYSELGGDLGIRSLAVVGLDQDLPVLVADPPHRLLDLPCEQGVLEGFDRRLDLTLGDGRPGRAGAAEVDHDI